MAVDLANYEKQAREAVQAFWGNREMARQKQIESGNVDAGLKAAAINDFRWHDLRHTYATWLGKAGAPLEVVSKALGHSSVTVTMKYRHVLHSEVRDAMQRLPTLRTHTGNVVTLKRS